MTVRFLVFERGRTKLMGFSITDCSVFWFVGLENKIRIFDILFKIYSLSVENVIHCPKLYGLLKNLRYYFF